jgi:DNA helicase-2/ATP-dependent DNA helicase PcrA
MLDDPDRDIAELAASLKRGSLIAAAGCGKTEQIARATKIADGRRLILTHTHAGVDALRSRLKKHRVPSNKYCIETIAGWCLRYSASFPNRSGLLECRPRSDKEWDAVYRAAARLLDSGALKGVLTCSYSGVFVDEYQDCSSLQHQVVKAIAAHIPVCIFGDPLQAIFDFKHQKPVEWESEVFPVFNKAGEMVTPWRWRNAGNEQLAQWLEGVRNGLDKGQNIDLTSRPGCVRWERLPNDPKHRQGKIVGTCMSMAGKVGDARLVVIGD